MQKLVGNAKKSHSNEKKIALEESSILHDSSVKKQDRVSKRPVKVAHEMSKASKLQFKSEQAENGSKNCTPCSNIPFSPGKDNFLHNLGVECRSASQRLSKLATAIEIARIPKRLQNFHNVHLSNENFLIKHISDEDNQKLIQETPLPYYISKNSSITRKSETSKKPKFIWRWEKPKKLRKDNTPVACRILESANYEVNKHTPTASRPQTNDGLHVIQSIPSSPKKLNTEENTFEFVETKDPPQPFYNISQTQQNSSHCDPEKTVIYEKHYNFTRGPKLIIKSNGRPNVTLTRQLVIDDAHKEHNNDHPPQIQPISMYMEKFDDFATTTKCMELKKITLINEGTTSIRYQWIRSLPNLSTQRFLSNSSNVFRFGNQKQMTSSIPLTSHQTTHNSHPCGLLSNSKEKKTAVHLNVSKRLNPALTHILKILKQTVVSDKPFQNFLLILSLRIPKLRKELIRRTQRQLQARILPEKFQKAYLAMRKLRRVNLRQQTEHENLPTTKLSEPIVTESTNIEQAGQNSFIIESERPSIILTCDCPEGKCACGTLSVRRTSTIDPSFELIPDKPDMILTCNCSLGECQCNSFKQIQKYDGPKRNLIPEKPSNVFVCDCKEGECTCEGVPSSPDLELIPNKPVHILTCDCQLNDCQCNSSTTNNKTKSSGSDTSKPHLIPENAPNMLQCSCSVENCSCGTTSFCKPSKMNHNFEVIPQNPVNMLTCDCPLQNCKCNLPSQTRINGGTNKSILTSELSSNIIPCCCPAEECTCGTVTKTSTINPNFEVIPNNPDNILTCDCPVENCQCNSLMNTDRRKYDGPNNIYLVPEKPSNVLPCCCPTEEFSCGSISSTETLKTNTNFELIPETPVHIFTCDSSVEEENSPGDSSTIEPRECIPSNISNLMNPERALNVFPCECPKGECTCEKILQTKNPNINRTRDVKFLKPPCPEFIFCELPKIILPGEKKVFEIIFRPRKAGIYHERIHLITHPRLNSSSYGIHLEGICVDPTSDLIPIKNQNPTSIIYEKMYSKQAFEALDSIIDKVTHSPHPIKSTLPYKRLSLETIFKAHNRSLYFHESIAGKAIDQIHTILDLLVAKTHIIDNSKICQHDIVKLYEEILKPTSKQDYFEEHLKNDTIEDILKEFNNSIKLLMKPRVQVSVSADSRLLCGIEACGLGMMQELLDLIANIETLKNNPYRAYIWRKVIKRKLDFERDQKNLEDEIRESSKTKYTVWTQTNSPKIFEGGSDADNLNIPLISQELVERELKLMNKDSLYENRLHITEDVVVSGIEKILSVVDAFRNSIQDEDDPILYRITPNKNIHSCS